MKSILLIIIYTTILFKVAAQNNITTDEWKKDISFLAKQMPLKHINLFKKTAKTEFELKTKQLINSIDTTFNKNKVIVEIAKIISSIKDGHSYLDDYYPLLKFKFSTFPFRLHEYKDGIYIQATHYSFKQHLGAKVLSINGININKCSHIVSSMFPIENKWGEKLLSKYGLTSPEVLNAFHITNNNRITYEIELNKKKTFLTLSPSDKVQQPSESFGIVTDKEWASANSFTNTPLPLYLTNLNKLYWYSYDFSTKTMYVQFNLVNNSENQNLLDFFDEVISKASAFKIKKFILDLRLNIGGETKFINPIVEKLSKSKAINKSKTFYVLISRRTFSSAQLISYGLKNKSKAIFVGEPTSINSHFFANSRKNIELPNSGLKISLSTREWKATEENQKCQYPDYLIEETFKDYQLNIDTTLNKALSDQ
ncbi:S41 family peptidase [Tenacibaculum caenipelagi]|uniref:Peptidase S41-like protein n=1 Tax=Tenacibaculum caenipelagi TaxID=1325435 RepID=A0A4V3D369_9FLAO|nr:hypothetical protein [Tenacibaculum caenipelagi]TDQ28474.1 hypothetical protein DFQ07_0847 [Tenacibaculum caenipelagi]